MSCLIRISAEAPVIIWFPLEGMSQGDWSARSSRHFSRLGTKQLGALPLRWSPIRQWNHQHRTRPQRSRQQRWQTTFPQRFRQQRRHDACVTSLRSAVTPAANGAIGAAWVDPGTARITKPTTAIANDAMRNIALSLYRGAIPPSSPQIDQISSATTVQCTNPWIEEVGTAPAFTRRRLDPVCNASC